MEENHSEKERTHPLSVDRSFPMVEMIWLKLLC